MPKENSAKEKTNDNLKYKRKNVWDNLTKNKNKSKFVILWEVKLKPLIKEINSLYVTMFYNDACRENRK